LVITSESNDIIEFFHSVGSRRRSEDI
jgi:hypothetical protein